MSESVSTTSEPVTNPEDEMCRLMNVPTLAEIKQAIKQRFPPQTVDAMLQSLDVQEEILQGTFQIDKDVDEKPKMEIKTTAKEKKRSASRSPIVIPERSAQRSASGSRGSSDGEEEDDEQEEPATPNLAHKQREAIVPLLDNAPSVFFDSMKPYMDYEFIETQVLANKWLVRLHVDWCEYRVTLASMELTTKKDCREQIISAFRNLLSTIYGQRGFTFLKFGRSLSYYMINRRPEVSRLYEEDQQH